ncbi:MAG: glycosyltransferase, partial [Candidatus Nanohaloarchaea archaeon]|nr:glycosyltransferase [Candidatus Nanohaloarchaea archaeon]
MRQATLITTVYNESDTIRELLDSIVDQSETPDEVVIVDGGSDDGTYDILQEYAEEYDYIRALQEPGCNIAEGRNIAVEEASNDYIVGTDGGCVLDEDWYSEMTAAFDDAEYIIGMFRPLYDNLFEKVQGYIVCSPHTVEELEKGNRGPSSRSVGFSRQAWKDAGGYPEDLYTGEDSKFNAKVMAAGYEPAIAEDAVVYWRMRPSWRSFFDQFFTYGEGDARGGNLFTHPSQKLGISKNVWLKLQGDFTILTMLLTLYGLWQGAAWTQVAGLAFLGGLAVPTLYYLDAL